MRKRTPLLEWQIVERHDEWEAALLPPMVDTTPSALAAYYRLHRRYVWGGLLALLLLLVSAGGWLWHTAQTGLDQIEGELSSTVAMELVAFATGPAPIAETWSTDKAAWAWEAQLAREQSALRTVLASDSPEIQQNTAVNMTHLQGNRAVMAFVTTAQDGQQSYRQTRFYRNTAEGWSRTMPDATLWGAPGRLESSHFIFQFRQNDAQVVAVVAPLIDVLYTKLLRNFGLTPNAEKLVIEVTVERVTGATITPRWAREPLVVPSPALYLAPAELRDSTLLAQSITLPLIEYLGERAIEDYAIPLRWRPLLDSLQLWQLWDLEMPLAHWRQDIVKWLYIDVSADYPERHSVLPDTYAELCAMHSLWMLAPSHVGIPLECTIAELITWSQGRRLAYIPHTQLDQLGMPLTGNKQLYDIEENYFYRSHKTVSVATLVEYAVAAYGYEQLPVLLAGLARNDTWDTLLPAVYGVSPSEFEKGWQAYLVDEYALQPNLLRR